MENFTKGELKIIIKALKVLIIISDGAGRSIKYFNKLEDIHKKAEALLKEA